MIAKIEQNPFDIFHNIYNGVNGSELNKIGKAQNSNSNIIELQTMYGEITIETIAELSSHPEILSKGENKNTRFLDVGSGVGNAAIGMAMFSNIQTIHGVEIMPETYQQSLKCLERLNIFDKISANKIQLFNENAVNFPIENYDVIYANHPVKFDSPARPQIINKFNKLKIGSIVISVIGSMDGQYFEKIQDKKMQFSWGLANVYIHKKIK